MGSFERLISLFREKGSCVIAFSGGVDSSVAALGARRSLDDSCAAVMIVDQTVPEEDVETAARVAGEIGIPLHTVEVDLLANRDFTSNPPDRCALCKGMLMPKVMEKARELGFSHTADGANLDDLEDYRPGLKVSDELGIWHPLMEAGIGKKEGRRILKDHGISVHDRPSSPCLASRIPYGQRITAEKLRIINRMESGIRGLGFRDVRVRLHETSSGKYLGIIEVDSPGKAFGEWERIREMSRGMDLFLDPEGYRQGSLNRGLDP